ncbi:raffinose/stachyose/melibiose transport system substrate-binding protein [Kibdelosporangium banguiense]|uniref:Raffinose/stachyose/melibiose transport system substrate-binding protein n=1 Tax=Kibdelosporangium banguiense TaxID=1365924 RepID=A0ABS4TYB7_9PSEU|nr:extracellular solute-binding protein [Kibdelosporangium banguiense]MBP2328974.1 raffinose/stachyose/melibiose transport system substrate-binding protein [Kibdelosporangium banguiense]
MSSDRRRGVVTAAAAALCLTVAAGCSSGSGGAQGSTTADLSGPAPTGVTLTLWHNTADGKALLNLYKAYEKASGNKIEFFDVPADSFENTVQAKWATGARPDVLEYHGVSSAIRTLNGANTLVDLSSMPFVAKEGALAKVSGNLDGKTYAVTLGFPQVFGVYYNKTVFTKAGVKPPQTFADLKTVCQTLKTQAPGVAPIFEAGGSGWPPQILPGNYMASANENDAYAQSVVEGKAKVNDPGGPFVAALTAYDDLRKSGCFNSDANTAKYEDSLKAVYEGRAAMVAQHSDNVATFNTNAGGDTKKVDETIGFAGVSGGGSKAWFAPSPLGTYYVPRNQDTTKQRAALDFVNWISTTGYPDYVKQSQALPTMSGVTAPELQGLTLEIGKAYESSTLGIGSNIPGFNAFGSLAAQLLAGQLTPQEAADKVQLSVQQAIAAGK